MIAMGHLQWVPYFHSPSCLFDDRKVAGRATSTWTTGTMQYCTWALGKMCTGALVVGCNVQVPFVFVGKLEPPAVVAAMAEGVVDDSVLNNIDNYVDEG